METNDWICAICKGKFGNRDALEAHLNQTECSVFLHYDDVETFSREDQRALDENDKLWTEIQTPEDFLKFLKGYTDLLRDDLVPVHIGLDRAKVIEMLATKFPNEDWSFQIRAVLINFHGFLHSTYVKQKTEYALAGTVSFDPISFETYKQLRVQAGLPRVPPKIVTEESEEFDAELRKIAKKQGITIPEEKD